MRNGMRLWTPQELAQVDCQQIGSGASPGGAAREMIGSSLSKPSSFEGWFLDAAVCPWLETVLRVKSSMFLQARTSFSRNLR